ncbi:MAG: tail-specific protease, partial [Pseudomonadota bacterium]|nr:tail-specific protease [Pseudomonadota bacterium]
MQIVVVRSLKFTLFSLIVSLSSLSFADKIDILKPTSEQSKAAIDLVQKLDSEHYRDQEFNDALSSRYFDEYLKSLDSAKNFFIQSDIAEFEKYRKSFDDDYKKGKLNNSFVIFNRFNERMIDRLEKVVKTLDDPKTKFDFDEEESIVLDREKAPWPANQAEADKLWQQYLKSNLLNSMLSGKKLDESKTTLRKRYANQLRR